MEQVIDLIATCIDLNTSLAILNHLDNCRYCSYELGYNINWRTRSQIRREHKSEIARKVIERYNKKHSTNIWI